MRIFSLTIIFLLIEGFSLVCAREELRYVRYTTDDGLPSNRITSLCNDSKGNVWMNTWNGLCKWDGEKMTSIVSTKDGLYFGRTSGIQETKDGKLVFLNDSKQRQCYDPQTGKLCPIPDAVEVASVAPLSFEYMEDESGLTFFRNGLSYHIPYDEGVREEKVLWKAFEDKNGQLWFNFNNSLYRVWFEETPFHHFQQWPYNGHWSFKSTVRALTKTPQGELVAASRNFQLFGLNPDSVMHVIGNAYDMAFDNRGRLWMGFRQKGLYVWSKDKGVRPAMDNLEEHGLSDLFALSMNHDQSQLWAGTWGKGIRIVDISSDSVSIVRSISNDSLNSIHKICHLSNGNVGICSTKGFHVYTAEGELAFVVGRNMDVLSAQEISGKGVLFCTMGQGLYWLFPGSVVQHESNMNIQDRILAMTYVQNRNLWLASDSRLFCYDTYSNEVTQYDTEDFGENISFSEGAMTTIGDSLLYIGTSSGIMEVNLSQLQPYLVQREELAFQQKARIYIICFVFLIALLCLMGGVWWHARRWTLNNTPQKQYKKVSLAESLNFVEDDSKAFVEKLTSVMNRLLSNQDADIMLIASEMGISKNTLYVRCNEILKSPPAAILQNMRIDYAIHLMEEGHTQIKEISFQVGFGDPKYFSKVFKSKTGISPSRYLEMVAEKKKQ